MSSGKTPNSWLKHDYANRLVHSQVYAYRANHSHNRILLIDGNAGDGLGAPRPQYDLFNGEQLSQTTSQVLCGISRRVGNCDVVLCDKDREKREQLMTHFPRVPIVERHSDIISFVNGHKYVLWLSDPCGPRGHGPEYMAQVARLAPLSDFVIMFNEGAVRRIMGTQSSCWQTSRENYGPLLEPRWWLHKLNKRFFVRTDRVIQASSGFRYRVLLVSNFIADQVKRGGFEIIDGRKIEVKNG